MTFRRKISKLLAVVTLNIALVTLPSSSSSSTIATFVISWSTTFIVDAFTLLKFWIIGILGFSPTIVMVVSSASTHGPFSLHFLVLFNKMTLQINLSHCFVNIPLLYSLLTILKRTLQILFSHSWKVLELFNGNHYVIKSRRQQSQDFINHTLLGDCLSARFHLIHIYCDPCSKFTNGFLLLHLD